MSRSKVGAFFEILERKMIELVLLNKPDRIFNADESGPQTNTRVRHVVCEKSKKNVHLISPKRKWKQSNFLLVLMPVEITCHQQLFLKARDCTLSTRDSFRLVAIYLQVTVDILIVRFFWGVS
jgi:hypothetical protein